MSEAKSDLALSPGWLRFGYPLAFVTLDVLMAILGPVVVHGKYRVPKTGSLLILSNHLADVDPIAVQVSCNRPVRFMGKSELFSMPILGWILRTVGAFPVKRGEPDREALKKAINLIKAGEAVCVFPEGQLSEDGELQELKPGVGLIARNTGAQVICVGLRDTNRMMPYGQVIPRPAFRRIHVTWGEPRVFDKSADAAEVVDWARGQLLELTAV